MLSREYRDGREDGLEPLTPIDIEAIQSFPELLDAMSRTAFGGRRLGEAFHVLKAMAADPDCLIVVTLSGAMTIAKMGLVLCSMINRGLAHVIVSTGALMAHGLSEAVGGVHYKHDPASNDEELFRKGYNRVYDTLEMEANLNETARTVGRALAGMDWDQPTCSHAVNREIGRLLFEEGQMPSVLGCAYDKGVPVFVPAFTDSELGLDMSTFFLGRNHPGGPASDPDSFLAPVPPFNPFLDLHDFAARIIKAKTLGIFTIGGGVPRNWAQQVGPFADIINVRVGAELEVPRYKYGVRLCPEPAHWGGLSGCTYSEGVSWGKFLSRAEGGMFAEVHADATLVWPLLIKAVIDQTDNDRAGG